MHGCCFWVLLLMRVIAATFCVTLGAALAARQGTTSMASFQIFLQIWFAASLLAVGLAVAGQLRILFFWVVYRGDSAYQCFIFCFRWSQLWSIRFCIFSLLNDFGVSSEHIVLNCIIKPRLCWYLGCSIFMSLRTVVGFWRIGTGKGPWCF